MSDIDEQLTINRKHRLALARKIVARKKGLDDQLEKVALQLERQELELEMKDVEKPKRFHKLTMKERIEKSDREVVRKNE